METTQKAPPRWPRSRRLAVAGIGLTLLILAGAIAWGALQLRRHIRAQIVGRDADILHGVAQMVQMTQEKNRELGAQLEDLPDQLAVALQISELNQFNGVMATRVFDATGRFAAAIPPRVAPMNLAQAEVSELRQLRPVSRFRADAGLAGLFEPGTRATVPGPRAPLLEVFVPLHRQGQSVLLGIVQFIMDGEGVGRQFAALDRNLAQQALLVFCVGAVVVVFILMWAFRRLEQANRLLSDRTNRLLRTNEELTLAAKTSAVGAITAHLVHDLSSPLAGLEELVTSRDREQMGESDWEDAATTARQLQAMIAEIIRMLGEEQAFDCYEISLEELIRLVRARVSGEAEKAGVRLTTSLHTGGSLPNREANLAFLILENLLKNAIEATSHGHSVGLTVQADDDGVVFEVRDEGSGVPAELQARLFAPCRSRKRRGHGIGLALCRQLASHLEARLELKSTSARGSVFILRLPRRRFVEKPALESRQQMN